MLLCPRCGSQNILRERSPNGYTTCQACNYKDRSLTWDKPKEPPAKHWIWNTPGQPYDMESAMRFGLQRARLLNLHFPQDADRMLHVLLAEQNKLDDDWIDEDS